MGIILTIANQKGGVGKTLTATCLAALLTEKNYKVLTISLDPQRNFDMVAGEGIVIRRNDYETLSMLHVIRGDCNIKDAIVPSRIGDVARSSSLLYQWTGEQAISAAEYNALRPQINKLKDQMDARLTTTGTPYSLQDQLIKTKRTKEEVEQAMQPLVNEFQEFKQLLNDLQEKLDRNLLYNNENQKVLDKILQPIKNDYDFILIDTNPSLTLLTLNSLFAADYVLIPAFSEYTSQEAIIELQDTIRTIMYYNPSKYLKVIGILMTKCETRMMAYKRFEVVYEQLAAALNTRLFHTRIRSSARAKDYVDARMDLIHYDPKGNTTMDYRAFTEELLETIKQEEMERYGQA